MAKDKQALDEKLSNEIYDVVRKAITQHVPLERFMYEVATAWTGTLSANVDEAMRVLKDFV